MYPVDPVWTQVGTGSTPGEQQVGCHPQDLLGTSSVPWGQLVQDHSSWDAIPSCPGTCWGWTAPYGDNQSHLTQLSQDLLGMGSTLLVLGSPFPEPSQDGQMEQHPMKTADPSIPGLSHDI